MSPRRMKFLTCNIKWQEVKHDPTHKMKPQTDEHTSYFTEGNRKAMDSETV